MRDRGSRAIQRALTLSLSKLHNQSGFTCERTKASPAHDAGKACLLEAVPDARKAEAMRPVRGIPMRADIEHPTRTPCGMYGTSRMSGHREWRTEPVEDSVSVRTDRNRNASRHSASRPYP